MKKLLYVIGGIISLLLIGIGVLVFIFKQEMKPDKEQEKAAIEQGEDYIEKHLSQDFVIYDALYDNMGNYFGFEYAAKAEQKSTGIQFLIYEDSETGNVTDNYIANRWSYELENAARPYITEHIPEASDLIAYFEEDIVTAFAVDPLAPSSYKEHEVEPALRMTISRNAEDGDDQLFNSFITHLQEKNIMKHGSLVVEYISEQGEILEEKGWSREF
jgi:hypothetical protein